MPRRNTHLAVAAICGAATAYIVAREAGSSDPLIETLGGGLGALTTAMLPDVFDPATSPSHRAGAHSLAAAGLVSLAVKPFARFAAECRQSAETYRSLATRPDIPLNERTNYQVSEALSRFAAGFAAGLPVGFLSHLGADALTPRGLPPV